MENGVVMRLVVTDGDEAVAGARVTSRVNVSNRPVYAQATTDQSGTAELRLPINRPPDAAVLVQATHEGRVATRKFRLRKPN
jgi:hypothetical protein